MNDPELERRFVCPDCNHVHFTWSARCAGCRGLTGLILRTGAEAVREPSRQPDLTEEPLRFREPRPPRLVIARPDPEPELSDPAEELTDLGPVGSDPIPVPVSEIAEETFARISTGLPPLDEVLGGGLVVASIVLLASPPGSGKTSLTLQMFNNLRHCCLYVTGEETQGQVAATARRVGARADWIYVLAECNLEKIFAHARRIGARTIAIDSIQKMLCEDVNGRIGSPTQLKECTARLVRYGKTTNTSIWMIGHVTGDGDIAGPKTIEHDVDVVLEMDRSPKFEGNERIVHCTSKNRFGPIGKTGRFVVTATGLVPVDADGWDEEL